MLNRDINGAEQAGFMIAQGTIRRGQRCSTAKAFLRPVKLRKNIHIALNAHVTKVLINPTTMRAYGVEFFRNGLYYLETTVIWCNCNIESLIKVIDK